MRKDALAKDKMSLSEEDELNPTYCFIFFGSIGPCFYSSFEDFIFECPISKQNVSFFIDILKEERKSIEKDLLVFRSEKIGSLLKSFSSALENFEQETKEKREKEKEVDVFDVGQEHSVEDELSFIDFITERYLVLESEKKDFREIPVKVRQLKNTACRKTCLKEAIRMTGISDVFEEVAGVKNLLKYHKYIRLFIAEKVCFELSRLKTQTEKNRS